MKVRYLGESDPLELMNGKVYDVTGTQELDGVMCYMVVDETGEDYPYEPEDFEIVSGSLDEFEENREDVMSDE